VVRLFFIFTFITICIQLSAQRGYEVGGSIGSAWYFGDINNELKLNSPGATIGVASRFNFDERICLKLGDFSRRVNITSIILFRKVFFLNVH